MLIMELKYLLNERNYFVGVVVDEAMMITKSVSDNEWCDYPARKKARPKTMKNVKTSMIGDILWCNGEYKVWERRYIVPVLNIYYHGELVAERQPVQMQELYEFKIGDIVYFLSNVNEYIEDYNCKDRADVDVYPAYVDIDKFYYEFYYDPEDIFSEEFGEIKLEYYFNRARHSKKSFEIPQNIKNDSEKAIEEKEKQELLEKQWKTEQRRQKRLEKQRQKQEEEKRLAEEKRLQEELRLKELERQEKVERLYTYHINMGKNHKTAFELADKNAK